MNIAEFAKLDWKCAAETYSAKFSQFLANANSTAEKWLCLE